MPSLGTISFGLAGLGFLLLTLLLLVGWEGRRAGVRLVMACGATSVWGLALAWFNNLGASPLQLVIAVEILRYAAWILVLTGLAAAIGIGAHVLRAAHLSLVGLVAIAVSFPWIGARLGLGLDAGEVVHVISRGGIAFSLLGMVMLEQVYRNARDELKYALRYLAIALGTMFAYDLFVFAQGELLNGIDSASWQARGLITALTTPMVALAARRNPHWALNIFVSRQVVFYTATFVAVGLYLLGMAVGGYLIAQYGGTWGRTVQLLFLAGAAMVLVTLLASADLRRRLRVFLAKHFYRNKYDYRVEWLRFIQTLSEPASTSPTSVGEVARSAGEGAVFTSPTAVGEVARSAGEGAVLTSPTSVGEVARSAGEGTLSRPPVDLSRAGGRGEEPEPYSRTIRAIAQIISSPGGLLFLRRQEGAAGFVPVAGWPADRFDLKRFEPVPAADDIVRFLEGRQWVIDVEEHRMTPDVYGNIGLPAIFDPPTAHRIVLPLLDGSTLLAFMVLDEPPPPFSPNFEDRDLLKTVGRHVATHIAQHEADRRLAESRQFEAYHRLTAFVMHDLKNLAAQLALIVANAEKHRRNPEFVDDAISTVAHSTERMQRLIEQLQGREQRALQRRVRLSEIVRRAADRCALRRPVPALTFDDDPAIEADPERLTSVVEHILRNAQDATPDDGSVTVRVATHAGEVVITITDDGTGMTPEFVNTRLFKPFDTTKGSKGMGIGAYQAREYVTSLGGSMNVRTTAGAGTTFEIRLKSTAP